MIQHIKLARGFLQHHAVVLTMNFDQLFRQFTQLCQWHGAAIDPGFRAAFRTHDAAQLHCVALTFIQLRVFKPAPNMLIGSQSKLSAQLGALRTRAHHTSVRACAR